VEQRRERQRQEARRAILDATEALLIESNGSDFSIRALGQRCGYSAPTVYHYFGDKDGLIDALLEERIDGLAEELECVAPVGDTLLDLRATLLTYVEFSASNPSFSRLMWTLSRKGESRVPPAIERVKECISGPMRKLIESGRIKDFEEGVAGQILWALIHGLVSLRLTEPAVDWSPDLAERSLDTLLAGMSRTNGPAGIEPRCSSAESGEGTR